MGVIEELAQSSTHAVRLQGEKAQGEEALERGARGSLESRRSGGQQGLLRRRLLAVLQQWATMPEGGEEQPRADDLETPVRPVRPEPGALSGREGCRGENQGG